MSAPILQISLSQAPVFVVNSRLGFFSAAACCSIRVGLHCLRPSFSRSYGCILPSSLTRVFPRTLGFSPRLPVSVLVRAHVASLEAFLGSVVHPDSALPKDCLSVSSRPFTEGICLPRSLPPSTGSSIRRPGLPPASLHPQAAPCGAGIFACCPSPMLSASA